VTFEQFGSRLGLVASINGDPSVIQETLNPVTNSNIVDGTNFTIIFRAGKPDIIVSTAEDTKRKKFSRNDSYWMEDILFFLYEELKFGCAL